MSEQERLNSMIKKAAIGQLLCAVCGQAFDDNTSMSPDPYGICPEHLKAAQLGQVALIAVENDLLGPVVTKETAIRTGVIGFISMSLYQKVFKIKLPEKAFPMAFVDPIVLDQLQKVMGAFDGQ